MKRDQITDFHAVPEAQWPIHGRLLNWARWADNPRRSNTHPMFRAYRSSDHWAGHSISEAVDVLDAVSLQKLVIRLPQVNRSALHWHYQQPYITPKRMAKRLDLTMDALGEAVINARTMLRNLGA